MIVLALLILPLLAVALFALRVFLNERSYLYPTHGSLPVTLEQAAVDGMRDVRIPSTNGVELGAWYAPSTNGVMVILTHGTGGTRADLIGEIRILRASGAGVLAFDFPGHGLSTGHVEWARPERDAITSALNWVVQQPGVDTARIGAIGFSFGGYTLAQVVPTEHRISAVVLLGTPADADALVRWEYRRWGSAAGWLAQRIDDVLYPEPDSFKAKDMVARIAPRPLLIVAGGADSIVPLVFARELFDAAREPKEFFVVKDAHHGDYANAGVVEYADRLRAFFRPAAFEAVHPGRP
jgi:uncharacterized protein